MGGATIAARAAPGPNAADRLPHGGPTIAAVPVRAGPRATAHADHAPAAIARAAEALRTGGKASTVVSAIAFRRLTKRRARHRPR